MNMFLLGALKSLCWKGNDSPNQGIVMDCFWNPFEAKQGLCTLINNLAVNFYREI